MASKQVISIHGETGHMAVDVKTHGMRFASVDGETEQYREWAFNRVQEQFWADADYFAVDCGFSGAESEGRSGGWAAPNYGREYPDPTDATDRKRFLRFEKMILQAMEEVPADFRVELQAYVNYEREQKSESERIVRQFCEQL